MRLDDFSDLPNGLHDALLLGISVDLDTAEARFDVEAWVGDLEGPPEQHEATLRCSVVVCGLAFLAIDPPDPRYRDAPKPGMIDVGEGVAQGAFRDLPQLPAGTSMACIFCASRNSYIHVAGTSVRLQLQGERR